MRPDLLSFRVNGHYLIGANLGLRVLIMQPDVRSIAYDVDFQANADENLSISPDGAFLAGAFSSEAFCCVEVIDLRRNTIITPESREDSTILRIERTHALDVKMAPNNQTLFYWTLGAKRGVYAFHLPSGQREKIPKATFPTNGAWLSDHALLPFDRGRGGVRVSYWPLTITPVELPSKATVWRLIEHPSGQTLGLLNSKETVMSLRAGSLEPVWQRRVSEAGWISYSSDGRFIAVRQHAPKGGAAERIVVLDASSGETARTVEEPGEHALYPLDGPRFLCLSGRFLNAETGEFEEGVSAPNFWKTILSPPK
jgi:hypothetical protein